MSKLEFRESLSCQLCWYIVSSSSRHPGNTWGHMGVSQQCSKMVSGITLSGICSLRTDLCDGRSVSPKRWGQSGFCEAATGFSVQKGLRTGRACSLRHSICCGLSPKWLFLRCVFRQNAHFSKSLGEAFCSSMGVLGLFWTMSRSLGGSCGGSLLWAPASL